MAYRPRIGITMRLEMETRRFYLGRDYSESIAASGGIPLHLGLIPDEDYVRNALANVDGILLPGSDTDIDPAFYGEQPHPRLGTVIAEKDKTDLLVLAEAERRRLPVLGICFGMQAINVSRGGSLIQDIPSMVEGCLKHDQGAPYDRLSHSISIESGTVLSNLSADLNHEDIRVNSSHHQAVNAVGENLRVTARASDGVTECIEDIREDRTVVGVQWHPEITFRTDPFSREIFNWFVNQCVESSTRQNKERAAAVC
jgi:putative glutamine amidotransferase